MYQYRNAVALARTIGAQWTPVDIDDILVYDIFAIYSQIVLELDTIYLDDPICVNMDQFRMEYSSYNGTLNALLSAIGNRALVTVPSLPNTELAFAKYSDAFRAEYKVALGLAGQNLPANYPDADKRDLIVTRPNYNTDMTLLHTHCLVTVNGLLHMTDANSTSAYVYDGGMSLYKSKCNHLGILSFLDIGTVQKIPVNPDNVFAQEADNILRNKMYLYLDQDTSNKTVLFSLGGYLLLPEEGIFTQTGPNVFCLNISAMPLLERYFESSKYLDFTSLGLDILVDDPDRISAEQFYTDAVLKKYVTLSQSFFIVIDTPNLVTNKINIRHSNLPGMFTCYQDPVYPLFVGYGKMAEYWKTEEDGHWSVSVQDSFYRNYVLSYQPNFGLNNVTPNLVPNNVYHHSRGVLLEIAGPKRA